MLRFLSQDRRPVAIFISVEIVNDLFWMLDLDDCPFQRPSTTHLTRLQAFENFEILYFFKMDLESSVFHVPGPNCYRRIGVRTSSHRVNGQSDVGVVVELSSQRKPFKNWRSI